MVDDDDVTETVTDEDAPILDCVLSLEANGAAEKDTTGEIEWRRESESRALVDK